MTSIFFFKQKTAYEMRISDWSSDVCSSDLSDPYVRIVKLFKSANASYRAGRLYLAIAAAEDKPVVQAFVRRVSERRMNYLYDCYCALGFAPPIARHWARFAYATFMGNLQIGRDTPDLMPADAEFSEYVKLMIKTLIPRSASMAVAEEHSSFSADPASSHATGD